MKSVQASEKSFFGLIGKSEEIQKIRETIEKIAPFNTAVLIEGESGTGKELVARAIHFNSPRKGREFVVINCSAFPDQLLESELFGHMRGSFTGAISEKKGLFEIADQGTFFLDEVGDMSPALQVKLLRVLQEGVFLKIGGTSPVQVNVRIIAATNQKLKKSVDEKHFREDLYFRLNVMRVELPPLRDRLDDVPMLIDYISKRVAQKNGQPLKSFTKDAIHAMSQYEWPGNVRELENEIEKAYILADSQVIDQSCLSKNFSKSSGKEEREAAGGEKSNKLKVRKKAIVAQLEKEMIVSALEKAGGNQTKAARELDISRQDLIRKIKSLKITLL